MYQVRIELNDDEYAKLCAIATALKERGYISSEDVVSVTAKFLLKLAINKLAERVMKEKEEKEKDNMSKQIKSSSFIQKSENKIETSSGGYSSYFDRAFDKATEKGRRILLSPFDDEYRQYLKEFKKRNLKYFD